MPDNPRGALFRAIVPNQHSRVTYAELLFDLVFVFAVTQVSHTLLGRFTPLGAVQTTLLFLAVWWVWVYTTWVTNWLNPELTPVRLLLFLLMLAGLVLSTSIPHAFETRGLWFATAYAAMQVGRTLFWLVSTPPARVAVLGEDLRAACLSALHISRQACVEFAKRHTWEAAARAFIENMAQFHAVPAEIEPADFISAQPASLLEI